MNRRIDKIALADKDLIHLNDNPLWNYCRHQPNTGNSTSGEWMAAWSRMWCSPGAGLPSFKCLPLSNLLVAFHWGIVEICRSKQKVRTFCNVSILKIANPKNGWFITAKCMVSGWFWGCSFSEKPPYTKGTQWHYRPNMMKGCISMRKIRAITSLPWRVQPRWGHVAPVSPPWHGHPGTGASGVAHHRSVDLKHLLETSTEWAPISGLLVHFWVTTSYSRSRAHNYYNSCSPTYNYYNTTITSSVHPVKL